MSVKGYKVFEPDWTCRGFQYKVGETFVEDVSPSVCNRGFHFCEKAVDCFNYYDFNPENKVAEVLALGEVVTEGNKSCTNKIQIVREIPWTEVLEIVNTGKGCSGYCNSGDCNSGNRNSGNRNSGDWNSGDCNSGDCNSGDWNSGDCNSGNRNSGNRNSGDWNSGDCNSGDWNSGNRNSGDWNSGNRNSGDCNSGDCNSGNCNSGNRNSGNCNSGNRNSGNWNSGDCNSGNCNSGNRNSGNCNSGDWNKCDFSNGCFNTTEPKIHLFNKPSEWTYRDWLNSAACRILNRVPKDVLEYILWENMSDEEKEAHSEAEITGGYLKELDTSECAVTWWRGLSDDDKSIVTSLPNFDKDIFKEITGVDVDETV
jgi:hypothetical protein